MQDSKLETTKHDPPSSENKYACYICNKKSLSTYISSIHNSKKWQDLIEKKITMLFCRNCAYNFLLIKDRGTLCRFDATVAIFALDGFYS